MDTKEISKLNVNNEIYEIKDSTARESAKTAQSLAESVNTNATTALTNANKALETIKKIALTSSYAEETLTISLSNFDAIALNNLINQINIENDKIKKESEI